MNSKSLMTRLVALTIPIVPATAQVAWQPISTTQPNARFGCGSSVDSPRQRVALFGGRLSFLSVTDQTWEWDGSQWSQIAASPRPPARANPGMVFDAARGRTVMLFGSDAFFSVLGDMWAWDGSTWTQLAPATMPPPRDSFAVSYDSRRHVVVLFGGSDANAVSLGDTWEWDGVDWAQRTSSNAPSARAAHAMCFDAARGVTVLFGGDPGGSNPTADTWEWDGTDWMQRTSTPAPAARSGHSMTFDSSRNRVLLMGGSTSTSAFTETWDWDGQRWTQRPAMIGMVAHQSTMQIDPVRGVPIIYGSTLSSPRFWEYVTQSPVGFTTYGVGCQGTNGTPQLDRDPTTSPLIAGDIRLRMSGLPLLAGGTFVALGVARDSLDLSSIGMLGCTRHCTGEIVVPVARANGVADLTIGIPNDAALLGALVSSQCFAVDPGANALGLTASNGAEIRVGI